MTNVNIFIFIMYIAPFEKSSNNFRELF